MHHLFPCQTIRNSLYRISFLCAFFYLLSLSTSVSFAVDNKNAIELNKGLVDYTPVQGYLRQLKLRREGLFEYSCDECHRVFRTVRSKRSRVAEHVDLKLNHGSNDNCLNCHHTINRNVYVTNDGKEIPADKPEELCAKCHGVVYGDWKVGAHGRTSGPWNRTETGWHSLVCTECHNPHDPKFPQIVPMPGPAIPGRKREKESQ
ncbi:MAG: hypothetical protein EX341_16635 [Candidatus Scalindua sp. SCAELEC01]|nr:hypothetical protein [Planctomycetota bacterium]RZV68297.1 MAG: hypothetical protein EX341_16635 [Candidatus Scalindua sp. SCAELEC01]